MEQKLISILLILALIACNSNQPKKSSDVSKASTLDTCISKDSIKIELKTIYDTTYKTKCWFFGLFCKEVIDKINSRTITDTIFVKYDSCWSASTETIYGILQEGGNTPAGINLVRSRVYFADNYYNKQIDNFINGGYDIQINFNYKSTASTVPFCTDMAFLASQAEKFFTYYAPYKSKIPFVCFENEWDNVNYHTGTVAQYLQGLRVFTEIAHKYGFKVADAGTTGTALQSWFASTLSASDLKIYKQYYFVNAAFFAPVTEYINGIKSIPIDYLNVHWYNEKSCASRFPEMVRLISALTGKRVLTNEFGIRDAARWKCTIAEINASSLVYAIAYSGDGNMRAVKLTEEMLKDLR